MILTVTPNPALDCTWHVDALVPGDSHRVGTGAERAGGKGVNVARVLQATGSDTLALATAGGDTGRALAADLGASGVPHRLVPVAAATRRSIAVVDDRHGEATLLNERGGGLSPAEADALLDAARALAAQATTVVVSGSLPPGIRSEDIGLLVADLVRAGTTTIADVTGPALLAAATAGAHVVKPNAAELHETTGCHDPLTGARVLLEQGAGLAVVSLGGDGMLLVRRSAPDRALRARLPEMLHGNPTGAGDAAVAAIAALLARRGDATDLTDDDLVHLARAAVGWSASAVLMPQAGEVSPERDRLAAAVILDHPHPRS
ncbi:1-phosphofructokinase family hexose kinase [Microbacterium sp. NPDC058021]|uniref:1-phosphofructokinase family hexose kinase n=1 Tax=Microbacterium sp. NPDC058021 TaxID=3346306 RepID=UPI0036DA0C3E